MSSFPEEEEEYEEGGAQGGAEGGAQEDEDDWKEMYPDWDALGDSFYQKDNAFGAPGLEGHHKEMLEEYGFELGTNIARVEADPFDNQVWKMIKIESREVFAAKVASIQYYRKNQRSYFETVEALLRESDTLLEISHTHIIEIYEVFGLKDPFSGFPFSFQVTTMELMNGTLMTLQFEYIDMRMPQREARVWFTQIASAVDYLHNRIGNGMRISHLAINPVNILYKEINPSFGIKIYKLTDFEESVVYRDGEPDIYPRNRTTFGINRWSSPEQQDRVLWEGFRTQPSDIFSLGTSLYTNILGHSKETIDRHNRYIQSRGNTTGFPPNEVSLFKSLNTAAHLLMRVRRVNPRERMNIRQILAHPWLSNTS